MATRYATKSGNWSDATMWDGGTTLPTSSDDVFANTFTVTIDQDITVLTLRNSANASPSITAGGYFQITSITGTRYVNITNGLGNVSGTYIASNLGLLRVSATSGTLDLGSTSITAGAASSYYGLSVSGAVTVTTTGAVSGGTSTNCYGIYLTASSTLTVGAVTGGSSASGNGIYITNGTAITPSITCTGPVSAGTGATAIYVNSATRVTIDCQSSVTAGMSLFGIATYNATTSTVTARGACIHGSNGYVPIHAHKIIVDPVGFSHQVYDGANYPSRGNLITLSAGTSGPAPSDVRSGVSYGSGLTGTMAVPAASSVRTGVSVDATTGTAALASADVWDYQISSGVAAKTRLANSASIDSTAAQISAATTS